MYISQNNLLTELLIRRKKGVLNLINISIFIIIFSFAGIMFTGGVYSNSNIIIFDALSILWSLIGLVTYIYNKKFRKKLPDNIYNLGYFRSECIGGLLSLIIIWIFSFELIILSIKRTYENAEINTRFMINFAVLGIFVNIAVSFFIHYKVLSCK